MEGNPLPGGGTRTRIWPPAATAWTNKSGVALLPGQRRRQRSRQVRSIALRSTAAPLPRRVRVSPEQRADA